MTAPTCSAPTCIASHTVTCISYSSQFKKATRVVARLRPPADYLAANCGGAGGCGSLLCRFLQPGMVRQSLEQAGAAIESFCDAIPTQSETRPGLTKPWESRTLLPGGPATEEGISPGSSAGESWFVNADGRLPESP